MADRIFTLAEARTMLLELEPILQRMRACKQELDRLNALIVALRRSATGNGGGVHVDTSALRAEAQTTAQELQQTLETVHEMGVQVKDIDRGLVDWVAGHKGHQVLLCWMLGEPTIAWWHDLESGFGGRQPVRDDDWD